MTSCLPAEVPKGRRRELPRRVNVDLKILDLRFKRINSNLNIDFVDILLWASCWIIIPIYPDFIMSGRSNQLLARRSPEGTQQ